MNNIQSLKKIIESAFQELSRNNLVHVDKTICEAIDHVIYLLDSGLLRVAEKINEKWITHQWIKQALFLLFYVSKNKLIKSGEICYFDKIPMKFNNWKEKQFHESGIRVVPPSNIRYGSYIARNTVLMPSCINIGSYIDEGTMVDSWSTVGSCAQIGKNVHLSGGSGIGGVLEPIQDTPTIIEDNCFIGARSEIAEGVIIKENSVISMGVFIGKSTKIFDRETDQVYYGYVPSGSVVVPGSLPSKNRRHNIYCAVIVKKVNRKTEEKTKLNRLLRRS